MCSKSAPLLLSMTLAAALFCSDCATIFVSSKQTIPVTSTPVGAKVIVNGVEQGVTPLEIRLARKNKGQVIRIESAGYDPVEIRPQRIMPAGPVIGNFLMGVLLGVLPAMGYSMEHDEDENVGGNSILIWGLAAAALGGGLTAIDYGGKGHAFRPMELTVTLTKADGTPRVDTMVLDGEDFRNIKWIRVRRD